MFFQVLGPVQMLMQHGASLPLRGARLSTLLALLLVQAPAVVKRDFLIEELWAGRPVKDPVNALHLHIAKLRVLLGKNSGLLQTRKGLGYRMGLSADMLDATRFARLAVEGNDHLDRGRPAEAAAVLQEALRLWRGPALAGAGDSVAIAGERARLHELRVVASEHLAEARLAQGQHVALVPELKALVAEHPLRESLRGLLMRALYGAGQQAEALEVFDATRGVLRDALGVSPSPPLRALHAALLAHDTHALNAPRRGLTATTPPPGPQNALSRVGPGSGSGPRTTGETGRTGGLVPPLDAFVGRRADLGTITAAVRRNRLVTVVGPGGVGKTRIALQAADSLREEFPDGICLVELASLPAGAGPDRLIAAFAEALAIPDSPDWIPQLARLKAALAGKRMLLVVDTCEHVRQGAAHTVDTLMRGCSALTVLATSREALAVPGETAFPLRPLPLGEAVELFRARMTAATPDLGWDDATRASAAAVCRRLDCLPLAIELAVGRTRMLTVPDIEARLADGLHILSQAPVPAPERHRSLYATLDWSHELLGAEEKRVFRDLSVLGGTWDLDAAEHVCADATLSGAEVVDTVGRLVGKSLLAPLRGAGSSRFRMLETVRVYAQHKLVASGREEEVRNRLAAWTSTQPQSAARSGPELHSGRLLARPIAPAWRDAMWTARSQGACRSCSLTS
ncbi:BTAD domain-containing putative transcriptional regulator [Streptomyces sp. NPDC007983]|uniref:AfsR/SARP family transcriptional regulator n=1 Tax=Streptomyces sp. NPDC007983 TaxID=3364800 RepID=UPI0036EEF53E